MSCDILVGMARRRYAMVPESSEELHLIMRHSDQQWLEVTWRSSRDRPQGWLRVVFYPWRQQEPGREVVLYDGPMTGSDALLAYLALEKGGA